MKNRSCPLKKIYFLLVLVIPSIPIMAQENLVRIHGKIINAETSELIPYAHIINITRHQGTSANHEGDFSLVFEMNDTLLFTAIGFNDLLLSLKDSMERANYFTIGLVPRIYLLEEVDIYANDPMQGFRRDTTRNRKYHFVSGRSDPTSMILGARPVGSGYVTAFANLFNRHYQQEKKLGKILEAKNEETEAISRQDYLMNLRILRFGAEEITRITSMTGPVLEDFMNLYQPSDAFLLNATDYEMALYIINSYREYRFRNRLDLSIDEILEFGKFKD